MEAEELEQSAEIVAEDRREVAKRTVGKTSRWPRTERRQRRIAMVLHRRQPDLTVVLENVHDPHNVSAVLRSCDAVGVTRVHGIYTDEEPPAAFARTSSAGAAKWIEMSLHESVDTCFQTLRDAGHRIFCAALGQGAADLYDCDLTQPTALVFGNEMRGVSAAAAERSDGRIAIPMSGMVESLNISVACAVSLYEALRQRRSAGAYAVPRLPVDEIERLKIDWLRR